jgi:hypothetical protein
MKGFFPNFSQQSKDSLKKGQCSLRMGHRALEHSPKGGHGALALPTMYRGALRSKIDFLVVFLVEKDLHSLSNDFSSS